MMKFLLFYLIGNYVRIDSNHQAISNLAMSYLMLREIFN